MPRFEVNPAYTPVADQAAARAADAVYARHPEWLARWGPAGWTRCRADLHYHLSYLADALANERPELFVDYVRWIASFLERRGIPTEYLRETLTAVDEVLRTALAAHYSAVASVLAAGRAALAEEAAP
jgi:hypothetical protein